MSTSRLGLVVFFFVGTVTAGVGTSLAQVDQHKTCSPWAWITHNCAINPNGPCCPGGKIKASGGKGQSGKAWHNDREACRERLEETYQACLKDEDQTRQSCDQNRRKGVSFCDEVEKKPAPTRLSAGAAQPAEGCGLWTWITHNCAINPNGPCCPGGKIKASGSKGKSGKAWHNNREACQERLEETYQACLKDDGHTRQSCDQNHRKGIDFCKKIEKTGAR